MAIQLSRSNIKKMETRSSRSNGKNYNMKRRNAVAYNQNLNCTDKSEGLTPHPLAYENSSVILLTQRS